MKRTIIAISAVLLTFLATTFAVAAILLNGDKILTSFHIISVDNVSTNFVVKYEKVKAAKYYDVLIYNERNVQIYAKKSYSTTTSFDLAKAEFNASYKIVVYAYDELGDSVAVNNPYTFKYIEPTFSALNSLVLTNEKDYTLIIDGELLRKDYKVRISDNGYKIKEEKLTTNEYVIPHKLFSGMAQKLDVEIIDGFTAINKISLYSKISPVSDIVITSPDSGKTLDYNDVTFTYEGGENATKYLIQIYNDKKLIKEKEVRKNRCVISSDLFEKAEGYKIKISALYDDYKEHTKSAEVEFTMNEKSTLKPAYINTYYKYVKTGTSITISNPNPDGTIYYTLDGSDPSKNGKKYEGPIAITGNITIKTVIMEPKKNNSVISEFPVNVGTKKSYSVYLSPSNQDGNIGVGKVGYTNEAKEMNDLSNYIAARLKEYNVKVYRNSPYGNINLWVSDSRYYGVDLHLAVHSNASTNHQHYGIETWINEQTSPTYSLANVIQDALMDVYYSNDAISNRGVKYANGALGEVNDLYVPFGILLEIGHHDYEKDAAWIVQNKELIGNTVADAILRYFGII